MSIDRLLLIIKVFYVFFMTQVIRFFYHRKVLHLFLDYFVKKITNNNSLCNYLKIPTDFECLHLRFNEYNDASIVIFFELFCNSSFTDLLNQIDMILFELELESKINSINTEEHNTPTYHSETHYMNNDDSNVYAAAYITATID